MLSEYYNKLVLKYFGGKKIYFFVVWHFLDTVFMSGIFELFLVFWSVFFGITLGKQSGSAEIDTGISQVVKDSTMISMTKKRLWWTCGDYPYRWEGGLFQTKYDRCLGGKNGFFKQQACDFSGKRVPENIFALFY